MNTFVRVDVELGLMRASEPQKPEQRAERVPLRPADRSEQCHDRGVDRLGACLLRLVRGALHSLPGGDLIFPRRRSNIEVCSSLFCAIWRQSAQKQLRNLIQQ